MGIKECLELCVQVAWKSLVSPAVLAQMPWEQTWLFCGKNKPLKIDHWTEQRASHSWQVFAHVMNGTFLIPANQTICYMPHSAADVSWVWSCAIVATIKVLAQRTTLPNQRGKNTKIKLVFKKNVLSVTSQLLWKVFLTLSDVFLWLFPFL